MSLITLLATSATLGLVGGVHCVAMCTGLQKVAVHGLNHRDSGDSLIVGTGPHRTIPINTINQTAPAAGALRALVAAVVCTC